MESRCMGRGTESVGRIEGNWDVECGTWNRRNNGKIWANKSIKNHLRLGGMLKCKRLKVLLLLLLLLLLSSSFHYYHHHHPCFFASDGVHVFLIIKE
jgi:hypothetical protein